MKTTSLFGAGVLLIGVATAVFAGPRGVGGARPSPRPAGGSAVSGHMQPRPAPSAPRPQQPMNRPNPAQRPANRPSVNPTPRPNPMPKPVNRPNPSMPSTKPGLVPTNRPANINKPTTLPGNLNKPNINKPTTLPGNVNKPNFNKPTTLPGNVNKPTTLPGNVNKPTTLPGNLTKPNINKPTTLPGNLTKPNIDRPTTLPAPGGGNRPMRPDLPGGGTGGNRPTNPFVPGGGGSGTNRPNIGGGNGNGSGNTVNKPTWINNRPNINTGGNNINTGGNRYNNVNVTNNNFYSSYNSYRPSYNRPWGGWSGNNWSGYYGGWHSGWHSGYWGSNAGWFTAGVATGWLLAPRVASYSYVNPFYVTPVVPTTTVVYNYSQPIITVPVAAPATTAASDLPVDVPVTQAPAPTPVQQAALSPQEKAAPDITKLSEEDAAKLQSEVEEIVNEGRSAFKAGAYPSALGKIEEAIGKIPNDPTMHEFRALVLFARGDTAKGDYKNASAAIYSVLASGPGWNWDTLSKLYPDTKVYGAQLKALEKHYKDNPTAGEDAFLLAYHYLTLEEKDAAIQKLEETLKLIPGDELTKKMLDYLKNPPKQPAPATDKPKPGS